jgi:tetratricopeptide (TPR) repeat protein
MGTRDAHGNPFSGDDDAVDLCDRAVDRLLRYRNEVLSLARQLSAEQSDVPMSRALLAYLHLTSTDLPDVATARDMWVAMGDLPMNARERGHHDAIGAWCAGDWSGAAQRLDALLLQWPTDLLALQVGHQLDFFLGDATNLRDRPGRTLPELDPEHPHTALVRGMQAFGLEEAGHYGLAEEAGLTALAVNPDDVWGVHAVVHTYEMQGRVDEGITFMTTRLDDWGAGNLFRVHNWWHLALYLLEAGDAVGALAIYDEQVHNEQSDGVPLEMLDASSLLWRLFLDGTDTGVRFDALADSWATRTTDTSWYVFNDVHAVMALVGADRIAEAEDHIDRLRQWLNTSPTGTNVAMTTEIGLPVSAAAVAFGKGRYADVVDQLAPIRGVFQHFGGSHAQRDVLVRTLLEAAIRAGQFDLARALVAERLSLRDTSVYGWTQQARIDQARDHTDRALDALETAHAARDRFAGAIPHSGGPTIT